MRKVRTGMMPPSGAPRPDRATLDRFAAAVEDTIDRAAAAAPNPGAPALHRLNRTEYGNAVRDLLDLPIDAAALLPGDDSSEGFDNMASVLSVSPALMQAYVTAAAKISRLAVGDPTISADLTTYPAPRGMSQAEHREGTAARHARRHRRAARLSARRRVRVPSGPRRRRTLRAAAGRHRRLGRDHAERRAGASAGSRCAAGPVRLKIPAGPQTIGVAIVRRANARGVDDLFSELASTAGVTSLGINGPLNPTGPGDTPSRRKIFVCRPNAADQEVRLRAHDPVDSSRPVRFVARSANATPTIDTLMEFFESGRKLRGFDSGIQYALARLLVDPQFIYRFERRTRQRARAGAVYRISDLELASRLSFFLWSSIPDEELLGVAANGRLRRSGRARTADAANAGRRSCARAGRQPRRTVAAAAAARRHRARHEGVRRQSPLRVSPRDGAAVRDDRPRGPQHPGSHRRRLHLRGRASGAPLRHAQHPRQPLPARHAGRGRGGADCWDTGAC